MSTPNPSQGVVPLDRGRQVAADLWDRYVVQEGMDPEEATRRVTEETGIGPRTVKQGGLRGAVNAALQGASFGFSDEIGSAIRAAPALLPGGRSFGEAYGENVEAARTGLDQFREEHPVASAGLEIAGGIGTGVGAGRALMKAGWLPAKQSVKALAAEGAGGGAVAGYGVSEGNPIERLPGTAVGGMLGGMLGTGTGVAGRAGGKVLDITGLRPRGRLRGTPVESTRERAQAKILEALERDEISVDDAIRLARETSDRPTTIMDIGGENTLGLARAAQSLPSKAKDRLSRGLMERAEGQTQRVRTDLEIGTGLRRGDATELADDIARRRAETARPLYEEAYERSVPASTLGDAMELPAFRRAYERGREIAKVEGVDLPGMEALDRLSELGVTPAKAGDALPDIPVQAIDYMKRGLDDIIERGVDSSRTIGRQEARALRNKLNQVLEAVDEQVPEFGQARSAYAGESALKDAVETGRDRFLRDDPRDIARQLQNMTEGEREMYRRGAIDALATRMEKRADTWDKVRQVFGSPEARARVRTLFDDEDQFEQFAKAMDLEAKMGRTKNTITGGSPTARIQAEQADLMEATVPTSLSPKQWAVDWLRRNLLDRARVGGTKIADEMSGMFSAGLDDSPLSVEQLIEDLRRYRQTQGVKAAGSRARLRGAAGAAGLAGGRLTGGR